MGLLRQRVVANASALAQQRVSEGSPCYYEITEGREDWTREDGSVGRYSWCGDFVTYVLMMSGIRDGGLLNRKALNGSWAVGENISRLMSRARSVGMLLEGSQALAYANSVITPAQGGDWYVMDSPGGGHVGILAHSVSVNVIRTFDGNGPGATTGTNLRNFSSTHKLVAIGRIDFWERVRSQRAGRPPTERMVATFEAINATHAWAGRPTVDRPDSFYLNSKIGIK